MVKPPQSENTPFTMSSEDFPALPGTTPPSTANNSMDAGSSRTSQGSSSQPNDMLDPRLPQQDKGPSKRGIITSPDGKTPST